MCESVCARVKGCACALIEACTVFACTHTHTHTHDTHTQTHLLCGGLQTRPPRMARAHTATASLAALTPPPCVRDRCGRNAVCVPLNPRPQFTRAASTATPAATVAMDTGTPATRSRVAAIVNAVCAHDSTKAGRIHFPLASPPRSAAYCARVGVCVRGWMCVCLCVFACVCVFVCGWVRVRRRRARYA